MSKRTDERMALRREMKFERHGIEVVPETHTEYRDIGTKDLPVDVRLDFTHAVKVKGRLEGRAESHRSALKRAHQIAHRLEQAKPKRKR